MKFNILTLILLVILPLSSCNKIDSGSNDPSSMANIATTPVSSSSERFPFVRNDKYGYIDKTGKVVIPAQYDIIYKGEEDIGFYDFITDSNFDRGLAFVEMPTNIFGKHVWSDYGYIDRSGKLIFKF